jgi:sugar phosphate isomerase/epimerase
MNRIQIGVQLYCVRGECQRSLGDTLKSVAQIGYAGAEPWGYNGESLAWMNHPAAAIRKMYDDHGITCCGIHLTTGALMGDNLKRTIELNQILGNRFLIIAADKQRMSSTAAIGELAGILNAAADKLAPLGMFAGYHAHPFDFAIVDGRIAWDVLFGQTRPSVIMQMDIGNCAAGNGDPIGTLRKFPNRARSVHMKDYGEPPGGAIGDGKADWGEILRICQMAQNTEWYVVEQGEAEGKGFDIPRRSFEALRRMCANVAPSAR